MERDLNCLHPYSLLVFGKSVKRQPSGGKQRKARTLPVQFIYPRQDQLFLKTMLITWCLAPNRSTVLTQNARMIALCKDVDLVI